MMQFGAKDKERVEVSHKHQREQLYTLVRKLEWLIPQECHLARPLHECQFGGVAVGDMFGSGGECCERLG